MNLVVLVMASGLPDSVPFTRYTGRRQAYSCGQDFLLDSTHVGWLKGGPRVLHWVNHAVRLADSSHSEARPALSLHHPVSMAWYIGSRQPPRQQRTGFAMPFGHGATTGDGGVPRGSAFFSSH